ncbi:MULTISPECIES: phage tail assembly chaperone G [Bacillus]|uniref:phage tail assembly chaperone G n=1 Tax=Bacillus TaxID=1386 RepID=UPI0005A4499C|nr:MULTISPECIES: hypothetical protein [Bacillus]KIO60015.1 hypothetical protein B4143_2744 [Bacillus subtilis]KJJ41229.1 hypothetical protein UM89_14525 [Bacillus subtilis]KKB93993.1 hypothetical protein WB24_00515 [Bacillus sp. CMAA 1185]KKJ80915.1 hypothetical protein NG20_07770 [Bacillus subtilis]MBC9023261.1 hypothetical protein [Bacillus subtilis]
MNKPLKIKLRIDGEFQTFVQEFVPFKIKRKALEIEKYIQEEKPDIEEIEKRHLNMIVEIFDRKFTLKQLENGLNAIGHQDVIYDIIGVGILGYKSREEIEKEKEDLDLGKLLEKIMEEKQESLSTKQ